MSDIIEEKELSIEDIQKFLRIWTKDADEIDIRLVWNPIPTAECEKLIEIYRKGDRYTVKIHDTFC